MTHLQHKYNFTWVNKFGSSCGRILIIIWKPRPERERDLAADQKHSISHESSPLFDAINSESRLLLSLSLSLSLSLLLCMQTVWKTKDGKGWPSHVQSMSTNWTYKTESTKLIPNASKFVSHWATLSKFAYESPPVQWNSDECRKKGFVNARSRTRTLSACLVHTQRSEKGSPLRILIWDLLALVNFN